jgi:hypothetical protein
MMKAAVVPALESTGPRRRNEILLSELPIKLHKQVMG